MANRAALAAFLGLLAGCALEARGLTAGERKQIEDEGRERTWPPLPRRPRDLAPLIEAGLKLCEGKV